MDDTVGTLLLKDKQAKILSILAGSEKEWHIADLAKAAEVTYVHTSKFIGKCEEAGIVGSERHGRVKRLFLTEKGKDVAKSVSNILDKIRIPDMPGQAPAPAPQQ
ncbi:MAG: MarR family transcriptional regulator [Candidatus Marsarchaeota archaeon]|nr:MarR family transcriptional regulator [Candidatus Marsarchaeota archaeon]MCL5413072.1 MarR family transcriptional regulator [Candidatus Marsarchaeota archaeon]